MTANKNEKTIMLAGTHGFVGTRALAYFKDAITVPSALTYNADEKLVEFIKKQSPDIIINAAAISDIGVCEKNSDASYAANVVMPTLMAKAAKSVGAKLLSFSSDQVYTGCKDEGPYSEKDILPTPTNVYARHKVECEERVLDICPDAILLRATWMYDMPMYYDGGMGHANRGNFLINMINSLMRGEDISCSSKEYRAVTYVRQVVSLLDKMSDLPGGIYNYGSENPLNMCDTAKALLKVLGIEKEVTDNGRNGHNLWMSGEKLRENGVFFDTTAEGFARCAQDYGL